MLADAIDGPSAQEASAQEISLKQSAAAKPTAVELSPLGAVKSSLSSLTALALRGTAWTIIAYGVTQVLRLVSSVVLSKLLLPQNFGLMTLLNTMIIGFTLFSDVGLVTSIITSKRGDDPRFLNTVWTLQVIRGIGLWIVCIALSWPLAAFYHQPQLKVMVPVVGLCLVLAGFDSTSLCTLSRHMAVRELALMDLFLQLGQLVVTVVWAWFSPSVWSLVGGRIAWEIGRLAISHRLIPGQRNRFAWDKEAVRTIFVFGRWIFVSTSLTFITSQADRLLLGRLVSMTTLGLYGIAFALADIPRQIIIAFCGRVAFPFVSKFSHLPRKELLAVLLRYRKTVLIVSAVLLSIVVNFGDLFLIHVYDRRYHDAAWMIPIFALGLWHTLLYSTTSPFLLAVGKPSYTATGYMFSSVVILAGIPVCFHFWGLEGAVWVVSFNDVPAYVANLYGLWREELLPWGQECQATLLFIVLCGSLYLLRAVYGAPLMHPTILR